MLNLIRHESAKLRGPRLLFLLAFVFFSNAQAQDQKPAAAAVPDVGIDQKLNQQIPLDLEFRDAAGKTVRLRDYFGKKPVVLSLVYYDCPML